MFVSAGFLAISYGVHDKIAQFFADREPPANNLYWHEKLMYLRPTPGYLFIPVMADTFNRIGIDRNEILGDAYIDLMEAIGHIAAKQEANKITHIQAVEECIALVGENYINKYYYDAVVDYLRGNNSNFIKPIVTPFNALHRGDVFLLSACILNFNDEQALKIIRYWFAVISSFLLLDDAEDFKEDEKTGDENAFLESGLDKDGIERIKQLLANNLATIKEINSSLAKTIDGQFIKMAQMPHIAAYLK